MSEKLIIKVSDIKQIIESDWDDNVIRQRVGIYILQKAAEQDKEIESLLDTKFIKGIETMGGVVSRCCRGRE